jgi:uncharacterized RDD family membrane protein YckC
VLSDPYQRGRYDEQRSVAEEAGTLDDGDADVVVASNGTGAKTASGNDRRSRAQAAREARVTAQRTPTITLPDGVRWPRQKQRVIAMVIDLLVVVVIFLAIGWFGANALAKHEKPAVVHKIDALQKQIDDQNKVKTDADKRVSDDKKANDAAKQKTDQAASDAAKKNVEDLTKQRDDQYSKLNPYLLGGTALAFGLGLFYLAIPSAITGRTLGKKLQHLLVLRDDGSPLGWGGAFMRYGLIVLVTMALFTLLRLGPLAGVIVLFGVTMWMRNGNMQGLHDRIAHTIVVSDEKA